MNKLLTLLLILVGSNLMALEPTEVTTGDLKARICNKLRELFGDNMEKAPEDKREELFNKCPPFGAPTEPEKKNNNY